MDNWETLIVMIVLLGAYICGKFDLPYGFMIAMVIVCVIIPFLNELRDKKKKKRKSKGNGK